jgi:Transposase, Mutator family
MTHRALAPGSRLALEAIPGYPLKTLLPLSYPDTNVIERLNEEFRRRVKTQGALPTEDAALVLLFGLVISGQIRLRRLDGWRHIPAMLLRRRESAA